ncbi:hypothetical protein MLD38_019016 [Melastoma candidum]|uniref:Uncharacterized protein n=1 Tax=Melastoma candidum TaxID=119954 RepID=A0ACB9QVK3_9MYRT|nr:hypothetical protein MLD38_019016 [Melastoma candidum]
MISTLPKSRREDAIITKLPHRAGTINSAEEILGGEKGRQTQNGIELSKALRLLHSRNPRIRLLIIFSGDFGVCDGGFRSLAGLELNSSLLTFLSLRAGIEAASGFSATKALDMSASCSSMLFCCIKL